MARHLATKYHALKTRKLTRGLVEHHSDGLLKTLLRFSLVRRDKWLQRGSACGVHLDRFTSAVDIDMRKRADGSCVVGA